MPLKKSRGNMYDWVTHMHSHLAGECPHKCSYCYVQRNRYGVSPRYKGQLRFLEEELKVDYGFAKTIFIEHMSDMFAKEVRPAWIEKILIHCSKYPDNHYVFQTKNPERALIFKGIFPPHSLIGTTIESNRDTPLSNAPMPVWRYKGILRFAKEGFDTFITIEPILNFDDELSEWIKDIFPKFVNIGADSKGCNLPEPPPEKIKNLIAFLQNNNIPIKEKINLERLNP